MLLLAEGRDASERKGAREKVKYPTLRSTGPKKKYGRGSIGLGAAGVKGGPDWSMKSEKLSPATQLTPLG